MHYSYVNNSFVLFFFSAKGKGKCEMVYHLSNIYAMILAKILRSLKLFYNWLLSASIVSTLDWDVTDSDSWRQYPPRADPLLRVVNVEMKVSGIQLSRRNLKTSRHRPRSLIHISRAGSRRTEGIRDNYIEMGHNFTTILRYHHKCQSFAPLCT